MKFIPPFRIILLVTILMVVLQTTSAQQIIVNSNGERIVMYPDGSWRMATAGDSLLLRQHLKKSEDFKSESHTLEAIPNRNKTENEAYILRQWNELHFRIKEEEKKVQKQFRIATNRQFKAAEQLHNAEANRSIIEPDKLAQLKEDYALKVKNLRLAKLNQKAIKKLSEQSRKIGALPPHIIERKLAHLRSDFNVFLTSTGNPDLVPEMPKANTVLPQTKKVKSNQTASNIQPQKIIKPYRSAPFECHAITDTMDVATGRRKIELKPALLFTHTDPDLRPYFKEKELITCFGKLSKLDAYIYLTIDFQIASSHSLNNFGSLQNGSLLRLRLLNGEYVSLYNLKTDRGRIDPNSGHTIFTGQYALGKAEIKSLESFELDKVRILWTTGYEDYDVYKVDFFIDHLNCLKIR